ncbi:universal stress protein, partial [Acidithiobacillus sp.]|uniref:universal stress protein n=1 Tax=Acidithiobacillus sp. TaxID=1872118 RepID=UPI0031FEBD1E
MSYRTIVAVITEHSGSTVTASYAIALAAATKARLVLYAAHAEGTGEKVLRRTEHHIDHLFAVAFDHGIAVTAINEIGPITRLLPKRVLAEGADLVFYPLLPNEQYGATVQTHTVHLLLRTVGADLAVMRIMHMGKPHPHRILVPLAGYVADRERRTSFLATLGQSFHAQLTLFHRLDNRKKSPPDDIAAVHNALRLQHLEVLERSSKGQIAKTIAMEAISHHHDLIVMGASERGMLRRLLFGNPAGDVMQHPPCNVIIF